MWKILGNIIEILIYASVYMLITMVAMKLVAASLSSDFERKVPENSMGFSLVLAAVFIGIALIISTVIR
jgi:hypothetical protein